MKTKINILIETGDKTDIAEIMRQLARVVVENSKDIKSFEISHETADFYKPNTDIGDILKNG